MSNPGEWIDLDELHRRCAGCGLGRSKRTLWRWRREGIISSRQAKRGAPVTFNWRTVEGEIRRMGGEASGAELGGESARRPDFPPDLVGQVAELRGLVRLIAERVGVSADQIPSEGENQEIRRAG